MFRNRIRLPLYTKTPQFPTEAVRFRKANGVSKTLSVVIRKTYEVITDYMPESMHQKLSIALNHDDVTIEGERYIGGIVVDGEYQIEWPDFIDYPLGQAKVLIQVTPFDATNSNCQSCDVLSQLSLVDDDIGAINENADETFNVFANDTICCSPVTAEVTWFNTTYVSSATIDASTGIMSIGTGVTTPSSGGSVKIATYRVTCPDGTYDDADVYADVTGTDPSCETPTELASGPVEAGYQVVWSGTAGDFEWQLFTCEDLGTPVQEGTTSDQFVELTGLSDGQCYQFCVRRDCGGEVFSEYACLEFTIPVEPDTCGRFLITAIDGTLDPTVYDYSYMNCAGVIINSSIANMASTRICMLMDEFNVPIYFVSTSPYVGYTYEIPC